MTLTDELLSLTEEVPAFVRVDPEAAWRIARRRRVHRRAGVALVLMVAGVLVIAGLRGLSRPVAIDPADGADQQSLTLPTRIEHPYLLGDLPHRAGRLAGVIWSKDRWLAVSPTGHLWRLPLAVDRDYPPAISADGSTVAFVQDLPGRTRLLVWNTATGMLRFFSEVRAGLREGVSQYQIAGQSPAYFSPDGTRLIVPGTRFPNPGSNGRALLLDTSGGANATVLDSPRGTDAAFPAGWLDEDHLVWIATTRKQPIAVVATLTGAVVRTVRLPVTHNQATDWSQWVGPVSPDGSRVAVAAPGTNQPTRTFSLDVGAAAQSSRVSEQASGCPLSWGSENQPVQPLAGTQITSGNTAVVADPSLHVDCSIWATDALTGQRHNGVSGTLFGTDTAWWTWWWRELAAGLIATLVIGSTLVRWRHRIWRQHTRHDPTDANGQHS